jgi:hypothetical protein
MTKIKKIFIVTCILGLYLAAFSAHPVWAQSVLEGKITGTVSDDKGELLPGATAEITGPTLMGKRTAVTSAKGIFVFLNVPPGRFRLTVGLPGFKTYVQEDIILSAGSAVELRVTMELGAIEEQVTVIRNPSSTSRLRRSIPVWKVTCWPSCRRPATRSTTWR